MELENEKERVLEVEIERLLPGGVGLAHAEGLTLFVSLAAPGDIARVKLERVQGEVGFASIVEVLKPSPVRIEPPCPYFGRCGGCDFQQLSYEAQLKAKVDIIRDCLHRIGKIELEAKSKSLPRRTNGTTARAQPGNLICQPNSSVITKEDRIVFAMLSIARCWPHPWSKLSRKFGGKFSRRMARAVCAASTLA